MTLSKKGEDGEKLHFAWAWEKGSLSKRISIARLGALDIIGAGGGSPYN